MDTTASAIVPIPLDNLIPSSLNARTIDDKPLDEMIASILSEGLMQNLTVVESADGKFEVVAGERRRRALVALRERGDLPAELASVPCRVVENGRAMSASLAENTVRVTMHPADELIAFRKLVDDGRSVEEIAHEFGLSPLHVQRRLRLARVAPALFEQFRDGDISLAQMHALAVTDDHESQLSAWNGKAEWQREPHAIRSRLIQSEIDISKDRAAQFVGVEAIVNAGAIVRPDLFGPENSGFTTDRAIIDELAIDKLEQAAESVRAEGWSWVVACVEEPDDLYSAYSRVWPAQNESMTLNKAERKRLETLRAELSALEERMSKEENDTGAGALTEAEFERHDQLEEEIEQLKERAAVYAPEQLAKAGAFVTIGAGGALLINRGYVRNGDKSSRTSASKGGGADKKAKKPEISEALTRRLTAHRTAILQGAILENPKLALALLAHSLLLGTFYRDRFETTLCGIAHKPSPVLETIATELPLMRHWNAMHERIQALQKTLPPATGLFVWLLKQDDATVRQLLAISIALSTDTTVGNDQNKQHNAAVDALVAAAGVDFADHWEATRETFLGHVPRAVIEATVLEAVDQASVERMRDFNKAQIVDAAEEVLKGKRWLPKILRSAKPKTDASEKAKPAKKPSSKKSAASTAAVAKPAKSTKAVKSAALKKASAKSAKKPAPAAKPKSAKRKGGAK